MLIGLKTPILRAIICTNHVLLMMELTNICINNNNQSTSLISSFACVMSINKKKEVLRLDIKGDTAHCRRGLSATQKKNLSQFKRGLLQCKESLSSIQGEALFDVRKRPLQMEKGVPSFLLYWTLFKRWWLVTHRGMNNGGLK